MLFREICGGGLGWIWAKIMTQTIDFYFPSSLIFVFCVVLYSKCKSRKSMIRVLREITRCTHCPWIQKERKEIVNQTIFIGPFFSSDKASAGKERIDAVRKGKKKNFGVPNCFFLEF